MALLEFNYEAKNRLAELVQGKIEATSEAEAVDTLHERGLTVLSLTSTETWVLQADLGRFLARPNNKDIVVFTRQLATIIAADVPLIDGLETIARQTEKPTFARVVGNLADEIRGGSSLSGALIKQAQLFSNFYISLVKSGEVSGRMEQTLLYLADYLERSQGINSKIRGAMTYPGFILVALVGITLLMMRFVLPQMLSFITEAGIEDIPLVTRIMKAMTDAVNNNMIVILGILAFLVWFVWQYKRTTGGQQRWDRIKIDFPRLGVISRNIYVARMAETLSTLIKSGVSILEGIHITAEIVNNSIYRDILLKAEKNVQNGGSISEIFYQYPEIPKLVASMVSIGEKTGKTDFMLENIFKFYNAEAERDIQNLSHLIEPIMILILGAGVAILVSAIMLPMFSLVNI